MGRSPLWIVGRRAEYDLSILPDIGVIYFGHEFDNRRWIGVSLTKLDIKFKYSSLIWRLIGSSDPSLEMENVTGIRY